MNSLKSLTLLLSMLPFTVGCAGCQNNWKHMQSGAFGLNRTITLYGADGASIREWKTKAKVEDRGGTCWFLDAEGNAVTISGTFVIEEK